MGEEPATPPPAPSSTPAQPPSHTAMSATLAYLRTIPEPSPFCYRHPIGSDTKCGPCGGARKRNESWHRAHDGDHP